MSTVPLLNFADIHTPEEYYRYARLIVCACTLTQWIGKQCCLFASNRENYLTRCSVNLMCG